MKKFGSKSGFTLVELIVVIAILGILAGIAVPAYSGYIKKANEAADLTQLDSIKTAVDFAYIEKSVQADKDGELTKIVVTASDAAAPAITVTGTADGVTVAATDIEDYCKFSTFKFKSDNTTATWTSTSAKWVLSKTAAGDGK